MRNSPAIRYELWQEVDGYSFFCEDNYSARTLLLPDAQLVWSCVASSLDEALARKDTFLGFKISYQDGLEVLVGDLVLIENGHIQATVVEIINSADQRRDWGVESPGVMLKSASLDLLYLPTKFLADEPLELLSRLQVV